MDYSEWFTGGVALVVGLFAFAVYFMQQHNEKKAAATVLVMDIRHTEQVIYAALERNTFDIWMGNPVGLVNWDKSKHLFASDLSSDEFAAFNRFFLGASEIYTAKEDMKRIFLSGLEAKAAAAQNLVCGLDRNDPEREKKRSEIIESIHKEGWMFEPDEPRSRLIRSLQGMGRLTANPGFVKLKILAGMDN